MFRRAFVHVAFCRGNFGNEHLGVAGPYDWLHHGPRQDGFPWLFHDNHLGNLLVVTSLTGAKKIKGFLR